MSQRGRVARETEIQLVGVLDRPGYLIWTKLANVEKNRYVAHKPALIHPAIRYYHTIMSDQDQNTFVVLRARFRLSAQRTLWYT